MNMVGWGIDIILGGNVEYMVKLKLWEYLMFKVVKLEDDDGLGMVRVLGLKKFYVVKGFDF